MSSVPENIMYILLFSLNVCVCVCMIASPSPLYTRSNQHSPSSYIERIISALQKLDEDYKPQEKRKTPSKHTGKLSCTVEGKVMTSEMTIAIEDGLRTVKIKEIQKISCKHPDASIVETNSNNDKWIGARSSTATGVTMTWLTFITSSSCYDNIVYGVGSRFGNPLRILRFDLAAKFSVSEYLLYTTNKSISDLKINICGFASGYCPKWKNCLLYCYCPRTARRSNFPCKAIFFPEPDLNSKEGHIRCQSIGLQNVIKQGIIKSTVLDKNGRVYMMIRKIHGYQHSTHLVISSILPRSGTQDLTLKILKELQVKPGYLVYMDVNRNGLLSFSNTHKLVIDETKTDILYSEMKLLEIDSKCIIEFGLQKLVCWLYDGNGLVLISKKRPFHRKTVSLCKM